MSKFSVLPTILSDKVLIIRTQVRGQRCFENQPEFYHPFKLD